MEAAQAAESASLVVRVYQDAHGCYKLKVESAGDSHEYTLVPFTMSVQLWRPSDSPLLRAILQLHGSGHSTVLQSNRQLVALLQAVLEVAQPPTPTREPEGEQQRVS